MTIYQSIAIWSQGKAAPSPALLYFQNLLGVGRAFQLVSPPNYDRLNAKTGVRVLHYERFFAELV